MQQQYAVRRRKCSHLIIVVFFLYANKFFIISIVALLRAWRGPVTDILLGRAGSDARTGHGVGAGPAQRPGGCERRRALSARGVCQSGNPGVGNNGIILTRTEFWDFLCIPVKSKAYSVPVFKEKIVIYIFNCGEN